MFVTNNKLHKNTISIGVEIFFFEKQLDDIIYEYNFLE